MGILARILGFLPLIGPVMQGIEQIHGDAKSGAEKKQLALEALGLARGVAGAVAPGVQLEIDAATELAGGVIDLTYNAFEKAGWLQPDLPVVAPTGQDHPASSPPASVSE